jgi:enoyl-CoA hydratase/carnithine racemase
MSEAVLLQTDRDRVRILTMNRPDKRNALNLALTRSLVEALLAADADPSVGAVVLAGAGAGFCAGADLGEFATLTPDHAERVAERAALTTRLHGLFRQMAKPVVCAVQGAAMGGGAGLAIAGDLAVMAEGAKLGYPETRHGIVAAIVMSNLVRHVGRKAAFEIVALGLSVDAPRALALGMVNQVVPADALLETAVDLATRLAAVSPPAMALTKSLFHAVTELPFDQALEQGRQANERMRGFPRDKR